MESEKVKEIKKALKNNIEEYFLFINKNKWKRLRYADILTYINELEKENDSLKKQLVAIDTLDETNFEKRHNAIVFITEKQLKQFAEMLKEKLFDLGNIVNENDIDETLKEFLND